MVQAAHARTGALIALLSLASALQPASAAENDPKPAAPAEPAQPTEGRSESAPAANGGEPARLSELERELAEVMDELVNARARAGVLARSLFRTRLELALVRRADAQRLTKLKLALDGAPVHDGDGKLLASDRAQVFSGYLAPGMHELAIEIEERAREHAAFGYARSERFRIDVKHGQRTRVELVLRDDSDMAEEASQGDDGVYRVETELRVSYRRIGD